MPNPRKEERRKYCWKIIEFLSTTLGAISAPLDGLLHHQRTVAILLDSDDFRISKPFDMDKATLLPLRGSLGRKPRRATQAKVRAKKKKNAKNEKKKRRKKRRNEMKRIEKERKIELARLKTRKGGLDKS
ncbi:hypothetical protein HYC85_030016 [Camellia sinensis]|uniref:Uncharacterized protein n=1 Tax=Camellia sinensis TaxID=4442 RepID=A0A7J7G0B8_CAMSI|nr:hypothetical protein HYC85_030016 [Camellia sinensis]